MNNVESLIVGFTTKRVLVIGDIMLDRFIWGNVSRISPEAPVPVVNVEREAVFPGGAANVARNLVPFAGRVHMVGEVGKDADGEILTNTLEEGGIDAAGVLRNERNGTITKTRVIARKQQVVRIDREKIRPIGTEQVQQVKEFLLQRAGELDGLIISDYGKGFITQALVDAVIPIANSAGMIVTVDPNPNNRLQWRGVTSIKPNRVEAFLEMGVVEDQWEPHSDPLQDEVLFRVGQGLLERWGTEMVHMTLGEQGMILFERGGRTHHIPTVAREVFDVSGAGDTAIALFTLSLAAGSSPVEAAEISNYASGVVVGKLGTATLSSQELVDSVHASSHVKSRMKETTVSSQR